MNNILHNLNPTQQAAVKNIHNANLINAGAGSGKTRVLTYKIAYLLQNGISPSNVLALTFTNKAASEMKERIAKIVGYENAKHLWMGTFHSVFFRILRAEAEKIGYPSSFTIYDTDDSKSLLRSIIKDFGLDKDVYKVNPVFSRISNAKNNLITPKNYAKIPELINYDKIKKKPEIHNIYAEYTRRCFKAGVMDFDDLLLKTNILFRNNKDVLEKYQEIFKYIFVDEYQDTNYSQYIIIKYLAGKYKNITVVGDDSQSIYSFRGAKIENILNFKKDFPDCKVFKLEQNYRSTQNIVDAANSLIKKNKNRLDKNVFSENEKGEKIEVIKASTDNEEGYLVINSILDKKAKLNDSYNDFAILYRTNMQSRIFEEALRRKNIPYKIYGGLSFYQRKEIKDVLAYVKLIINKYDIESLKRIINYPARGIGKTTIDKIDKVAFAQNLNFWDIISNSNIINQMFNKGTVTKLQNFVNVINELSIFAKNKDAYETIKEIIKNTQIIAKLKEDKTEENLNRIDNIEELINAVLDFIDERQELELEDKLINKYLEEVSLLTSLDAEDDKNTEKITLMTIHSSKGLEYKHVYIVGVEQNLFPSFMALDNPQELEEERRLFYVAITRAIKTSTISYATMRYKYGNMNIANPSRFIFEINSQYLNLPVDDFNLTTPETKTDFRKKPEKKLFNVTKATTPKQTFTKTQKLNIPDFTPDNPRDIKQGMTILHNRFGKGTVVSLTGEFPNTKATVEFEKTGTKQLLLKFAKVKIL